jgi:hypothetical protein
MGITDPAIISQEIRRIDELINWTLTMRVPSHWKKNSELVFQACGDLIEEKMRLKRERNRLLKQPTVH